MAFRDWIRWARESQHIKLLFFNLKNEIRYHREATGQRGRMFDLSNLPPHIAEFVRYLDTTTMAPQDALSKFSKGACTPKSRAGKPLARPRELAGIKGFGGFSGPSADDELAVLGLSALVCQNARDQINNIITAAWAARPAPRNLSSVEKEEIVTVARDKFVPSPRLAHAARASLVTPHSATSIRVPSRAPRRNELMWVTDRDALNRACAPPSNTTTAVLSSAHITQVRRELGLSSPHDRKRDLTGGATVGQIRISYRIFLKFEISLPSGLGLDQVRQPNMFSEGFDYLFVSRRPAEDPASEDDMPGRTVRLVDKKCDHDGRDLDRCPHCGGEGLPEAIVLRENLFKQGGPTLAGAYVAFSSDLSRFYTPEAAMIRRKNLP